jgi:hypothetical protein
MLIYFESYLGDKILLGGKCSLESLKSKVEKITEETDDAKKFIQIFCENYDFKIVPFDEHVKVDFIIDFDTFLVYEPIYD